MENLAVFDKEKLMDMLAEYTSTYTRMLSEGRQTKEFQKCKLAIEAIQKEINLRDMRRNSEDPQQEARKH